MNRVLDDSIVEIEICLKDRAHRCGDNIG